MELVAAPRRGQIVSSAEDVLRSDTELIHFDVPTHTWDRVLFAVDNIRQHTDLPIDLHMISEGPVLRWDLVRSGGIDIVTRTWDSSLNARWFDALWEVGLLRGVAIAANWDLRCLDDVWTYLDMITIMAPDGNLEPGLTSIIRRRGSDHRPLIAITEEILPDTLPEGVDILLVGAGGCISQ
ncbi:MAG: hypothetical protein M1499_08350 [Firmicutes bacterium]|nr:hypothetical protein [Bacillota bacterium]